MFLLLSETTWADLASLLADTPAVEWPNHEYKLV